MNRGKSPELHFNVGEFPQHLRWSKSSVAVQLAPVIPVWLILLAMLRHYRRIDELQRLQFLQSMSLTAAIMAGIAWSYPAIQRAFELRAPLQMWELHGALIFVVISALITKIRAR